MLKKYEIVELPKEGVRHNFGDKLGLVLFQEGNTEHLTDEIAEVSCKSGLTYFKEKSAKEVAKAEVAKV
jgi:hypothetical protein